MVFATKLQQCSGDDGDEDDCVFIILKTDWQIVGEIKHQSCTNCTRIVGGTLGNASDDWSLLGIDIMIMCDVANILKLWFFS